MAWLPFPQRAPAQSINEPSAPRSRVMHPLVFDWIAPRRAPAQTIDEPSAPRPRVTHPLVFNWVAPRRARALEWGEPEPIERVRNRMSALIYHRFAAAARGLYRIFNPAEYRFYRGSVPPLESDTPFATSATLVFQPVDTFADGVWYLSVSYFNGVLDSGFLPLGPRGETYLVMEISSGAGMRARPGLPNSAKLEVRAGGVIRVVAFYAPLPDGADRATEWAIAYTVDGSTPATDTPTIVRPIKSGSIVILSYDLPAQVDGTTVKVRVQTRRGADYSLPGDVLTAVAVAIGPSAPLALQSWSGALPEEL